MAVVEFTLSDDLARAVAGFFAAGQHGRIVFHVENKRVLRVELARELDNAVAVRTFLPGATGVNLLTDNGSGR